jgi:hypothetical protein
MDGAGLPTDDMPEHYCYEPESAFESVTCAHWYHLIFGFFSCCIVPEIILWNFKQMRPHNPSKAHKESSRERGIKQRVSVPVPVAVQYLVENQANSNATNYFISQGGPPQPEFAQNVLQQIHNSRNIPLLQAPPHPPMTMPHQYYMPAPFPPTSSSVPIAPARSSVHIAPASIQQPNVHSQEHGTLGGDHPPPPGLEDTYYAPLLQPLVHSAVPDVHSSTEATPQLASYDDGDVEMELENEQVAQDTFLFHKIIDVPSMNEYVAVAKVFMDALGLESLFRAYSDGSERLCFFRSLEVLLGVSDIQGYLQAGIGSRTLEDLPFDVCDVLDDDGEINELHFTVISNYFDTNIICLENSVLLPGPDDGGVCTCGLSIRSPAKFDKRRRTVILHRRTQALGVFRGSDCGGHYEPVIQINPQSGNVVRMFALDIDFPEGESEILLLQYNFVN